MNLTRQPISPNTGRCVRWLMELLGSGALSDYRPKVGRCIMSVWGTVSNGFPALRHAARPPTITNALNPRSRSRCATRALVASRGQVQYR
jgi:hypothetical protein